MIKNLVVFGYTKHKKTNKKSLQESSDDYRVIKNELR